MTSNPAKPFTTTGHPHAREIKPDDFVRCKEYLAHHFQHLADQQSLLAQTPPDQLYAVGETLGIPPGKMAQAIAAFLQLPYLAQIAPEEVRPGVLSVSFCQAHLVVPLQPTSASHAFALCNPFDFDLLDTLRQLTSPQQPLHLFLSDPKAIADLANLQPETLSNKRTAASEKIYDLLASVEPEGVAEMEVQHEFELLSQQDAEKIGQLPPVVRLVNMILTNAVKAGASDIHIEPRETVVQVRQRIDGVLIDALKIPKHLHPSLVSRLKILARLDISEHRKPQDGRSRLRFEERRIDLRISILPTHLGPKVVIRILDSNAALVNLDNLSFAAHTRQAFERMLSSPTGLILVTGPTGSGKSTTLYAALNWLKSPTKNMVTVENPVEFHIPGITQVQIDVKAGMTFATGLRSILRQDPDIILVGEIRDRETAGIAIEASQTGHLLLSTLHTNDAPTTITRLIDLGIEPFKITSSLTGVLAQRLVRRVCSVCAVTSEPPPKMLEQLGLHTTRIDGAQWKTATGCAACYQSGFRGRLAIHELLEITADLRELIHQKAPDYTIRHMARQHGMCTLLEDGIAKAAMGMTTLEEVLRSAPRTEAQKTQSRPASSALHTPAAAPAPVLTTPPPAALTRISPQSSTPPNVLVLEDDADTQTLLQLILEKNGYAVTIAGDGIEALMQLGGQRFDLILSDVNMPNMDGIQLLEIANQKDLQIPVIFLTADDTEACEQRCLELGATDYIKKPIKKDIVLLRVKKALNM
jgi:type IV pilus assembly protein PilB